MTTFEKLTRMVEGGSAVIAGEIARYMETYLGGPPLRSRVLEVHGRYPISGFHVNFNTMKEMGLVERVEVKDPAWSGTRFFWTQKAIEMHTSLRNEGHYPR